MARSSKRAAAASNGKTEMTDVAEQERNEMTVQPDAAPKEADAASAAQSLRADAAAAIRMQVLTQYVRDMSFENTLVQKGPVDERIEPEVTVQVSLDARKRKIEDQYEVITKFRVSSTNKVNGSNLFLLELDYGGVFVVQGVPEEQLHPFLLIECPRMLFPFIRRIVADTTREGGFAPLNLDNVDFVALYRQGLARRAEAAGAAAGGN